MAITIKTRRIAAGSYEVDTPGGTYRLENCPTDRSDFRTAGLPTGPRWMLTWPGENHADSEFRTKRDAIESIRANEQWKADQAAKQTSPEEPPMPTETVERWEPAIFNDFKEGDRIRFWTNDNGFGGFGEIWRTGTVRKVTAKTIAVDCDTNGLGNRAVIRLADWYHRCPMKIKPGHRVEIDQFVRGHGTERRDVISVVSEPDGIEVQRTVLSSECRTREDFRNELRLLGWDLESELTEVRPEGYLQARVRRTMPVEREGAAEAEPADRVLTAV